MGYILICSCNPSQTKSLHLFLGLPQSRSFSTFLTTIAPYTISILLIITAKCLDVEETGSLGDQDILPQNVQDTRCLSVQEISILDAQEIIRQDAQESERPDNQAPRSPKHLDAIPLDAQIPSQLNVERQNGGPTERQVDKLLNYLSDEETKPLDGKTPNKKKAKSAKLIF